MIPIATSVAIASLPPLTTRQSTAGYLSSSAVTGYDAGLRGLIDSREQLATRALGGLNGLVTARSQHRDMAQYLAITLEPSVQSEVSGRASRAGQLTPKASTTSVPWSCGNVRQRVSR